MSERDPRFDTMELKKLRQMLSSVKEEQTEDLNLDAIIAEVNGGPTEKKPEKKPVEGRPVQTIPQMQEVPEEPKKAQQEPEQAQEKPEEPTQPKLQEEAAPVQETAEEKEPERKSRWQQFKEELEQAEKAEAAKKPEFVIQEEKLGPERQKEEAIPVRPVSQPEENTEKAHEKPKFVFMQDKLGRDEPAAEFADHVKIPDYHKVETQPGPDGSGVSTASSLKRQDTDLPGLSATWTPERLAVLKERKEAIRRKNLMEAAQMRKEIEARKAAEASAEQPKETQTTEPTAKAEEQPETPAKAARPEKKTGTRRWLFIRNNRKTEDGRPIEPKKTQEEPEEPQARDEIGDITKLDQPQQEEEIRARDPKRATKTCGMRARSLRVRSRLVLLFFLGAAYLTMGGVFGLAVPEKISYTANPSLFLLVLVILEIVSMLSVIDVVSAGLYNLITKKPDLLTAVSVTLISSLAHCIAMILVPSMLGTVPFTAVHLAILYIAVRGEESRASGKQAIYKAASLSKNPVGIYCHRPDKKPRMSTLKFRAQDLEEFLKDIEKPDSSEKLSRICGPAIMLVSLVLALIVALGGGDHSRFLWAYSAISAMGLSFGLLSAFCLPYKHVSRKMLREGVAMAGIRVAGLLSKSRQVVMTDGDLFPAGTVEIEGMRVFGRYTAERVLSYATAVIGGSGSSTYKVFAETLRERYGTPVRASHVLQYESGGLSAEVQEDSVLVGNAAFITRMGIPIQEGKNIPNGVFVVINNEIAGIFAMKYNPCAQSYAGIHTLLRNRKIPVLATRDFNIQPELLEKCFDVEQKELEYPGLSRRSMLSDREYIKEDTLCAIMSWDDVSPYSDCIQAAGKLTRAVTANLWIGLVSSVLGMGIMFFLTFTGAFLSATPLNVLLYLILWDIPVLFISQNTKKSY